MRLAVMALSIWLAFAVGAVAQKAVIGAYPPGSGPNGPGIGAYPDMLGAPAENAPPGPVESPLHHDQTLEYCRSQPGICAVKQPDNHDLAQHELDELTRPTHQAEPPPPPGPPR
jgi:hypothetical protein